MAYLAGRLLRLPPPLWGRSVGAQSAPTGGGKALRRSDDACQRDDRGGRAIQASARGLIFRNHRSRRLAEIEAEIEADENRLDILPDVPALAETAVRSGEWDGLGSESHVVVFDERRPIGQEHVFKADTGGPPGAGGVGTFDGHTQTLVENGVTIANPGDTAFDIEQPSGDQRVPEPARDGREPIDTGRQIQIGIDAVE